MRSLVGRPRFRKFFLQPAIKLQFIPSIFRLVNSKVSNLRKTNLKLSFYRNQFFFINVKAVVARSAEGSSIVSDVCSYQMDLSILGSAALVAPLTFFFFRKKNNKNYYALYTKLLMVRITSTIKLWGYSCHVYMLELL